MIVSGEMFLNDTRDYGSNPGVHVVNNTWVGSCNNMAAFYTGSWTDTPGPDVFENNIIGSGYWGGVSGDSGARTTVTITTSGTCLEITRAIPFTAAWRL